MRPDDELSALLLEAYEPCSNINVKSGICPQAKWDPESGHIPRGFLGAMGALDDVELVMVFAEPGHPHKEGLKKRLTTPRAARTCYSKMRCATPMSRLRTGRI